MKVHPQEEWELRIMTQARVDGWWHSGGAVVAAVSGGPDSMALLHLLRTMSQHEPFKIVVAHVNHQFRGEESDAEAEMVKRVAHEWGMPVETAALDLPTYIANTGMNAQSAAREKRYAFLKEVARKHSCSVLLFGHHAGDQAETVLMRIIRGTGPSGLAGIPIHRIEEELELIRPLLRITKCELLKYCERNEVPYALDSSNVDRHYFRNAVRLDLIPMLEKYNPKLQASLVRLADMAAADDEYMEMETLKVFKADVTASDQGFRIERQRFRGLHVALQRRLIKLILNCSSNPRQILDFGHVEEITKVILNDYPTVNQLDIGDGWVLKREYEEIYIGPSIVESSSFAYIVDETTEEITIAQTGGRFVLERLKGSVPNQSANRLEACFDEGELRFPLYIRSRLPGDVLQPYGLNGTKKVQDMFVDAKVPRSRRDSLPLLVDGKNHVLWIPGMRRSRHALVTGDTNQTLRIKFIEAKN